MLHASLSQSVGTALLRLDPAPRLPACSVEFGAQKEGSGSTLVKAAEAMFTPMGGLPFWAAILSFAVPDLRCAAHLYCLSSCMLGVLHVAATVHVKCLPYRTKVVRIRTACRRVWYRLALLLNPKMINQTVAGGLPGTMFALALGVAWLPNGHTPASCSSALVIHLQTAVTCGGHHKRCWTAPASRQPKQGRRQEGRARLRPTGCGAAGRREPRWRWSLPLSSRRTRHMWLRCRLRPASSADSSEAGAAYPAPAVHPACHP